jgi:hypothetical protein
MKRRRRKVSQVILLTSTSGQVIEESSTLQLQKVPATIYRLGHSDTWACKDCNIKGDKWFMLTHPERCKARNNQTKPG